MNADGREACPEVNETPAIAPPVPGRQTVAWSTLLASVFVSYCGFYAWAYTFTNFAFEELGVGGTEVGITRSLASIPGVLAFTIGALMYVVTPARAFAASFVLLDRDPLRDPTAFASPVAVYVDGTPQPRPADARE